MDHVDFVNVKVSEIADRWKYTYWRDGKWEHLLKGDAETIYRKLSELSDEAHPSDASAIIGNDSWAGTRCTFCRASVSQYFQIGEKPDYESATIYVCLPCAVKLANELLKVKNSL